MRKSRGLDLESKLAIINSRGGGKYFENLLGYAIEGSTTIRTKGKFGLKTRFGPTTNSDRILELGPN